MTLPGCHGFKARQPIGSRSGEYANGARKKNNFIVISETQAQIGVYHLNNRGKRVKPTGRGKVRRARGAAVAARKGLATREVRKWFEMWPWR